MILNGYKAKINVCVCMYIDKYIYRTQRGLQTRRNKSVKKYYKTSAESDQAACTTRISCFGPLRL